MREYIYILLEDSDGTTFSRPTPTGEAVWTKEEAQAWVKKQTRGYSRDYAMIRLPKE